MTALKFMFLLLIVILLVLFGVKNMHGVEIKYYNLGFKLETKSVPLLYVILSSLFAGAVFGWTTSIIKQIKLRSIIRKKDKRVKEIEEKLKNVRLTVVPTSQDSIEEKEPPVSPTHDNDVERKNEE